MKQYIKKILEQKTDKQVYIKINHNQSTMISIRKCLEKIHISLHYTFLQAPLSIIDTLIKYVINSRKSFRKQLTSYIKQHIFQTPCSTKTKIPKISFQGKIYNLKEEYEVINKQYFEGKIDLKITWFGKEKKKRSSMVFGLYQPNYKIIKIHKNLDRTTVPKYFLHYIIYHEMLHHVFPPKFDIRGRYRYHTKKFKQEEKKFFYYNQAHQWLKQEKKFLFEKTVV